MHTPLIAPRRIPALVLLAGVLTIAALLATVQRASADCDESFTRCDPYQEVYPFPMENRVLAVSLPLRTDNGGRSLRLYRNIVREVGYDMPARPRLSLYMLSVTVPSTYTRPFVATDYLEGNLGIVVRHGDEEGFYSIGMPMNSLGAQSAGYRFGYPKYVATMKLDDTAPFGTVPAGASETADVGSRRTVDLSWTHDDSAPLNGDVADVALFRRPFFQRGPVHAGPDFWRTRLTPLPAVPLRQLSPDGTVPQVAGFDGLTTFKPQHGYAHVVLDPDVNTYDQLSAAQYKLPHLFAPGFDLSDLVKTDQVLPGAYLHIQQTLLYQNKRFTRDNGCVTPAVLDPLYGYLPDPFQSGVRDAGNCHEGGGTRMLPGADDSLSPDTTPGGTRARADGSGGSAGAQTGDVRSLGLPPARACVSRRLFAVRVRAPRGAKLASAQVLVNGRVVRRLHGRGLRTQVDLRGLRAGSVRVKIVARTTAGRRVTATRRYRTCAPRSGIRG